MLGRVPSADIAPILDSETGDSNWTMNVDLSQKRCATCVHQSGSCGGLSLWAPVLAYSDQGGGEISETFSFRCFASLLISSFAGTSKAVGILTRPHTCWHFSSGTSRTEQSKDSLHRTLAGRAFGANGIPFHSITRQARDYDSSRMGVQ